MHFNGTAVHARHQASPVISGENGWLGDDGRDQPLTLRLRLPVSAGELAAALYHDDHLTPADLAKDQSVWALAALAIIQDGLNAIQRRADEILLTEARAALANPAWLELCRRRVAEVTGSTATGPAAVPASAATTTARAGAQPTGLEHTLHFFHFLALDARRAEDQELVSHSVRYLLSRRTSRSRCKRGRSRR